MAGAVYQIDIAPGATKKQIADALRAEAVVLDPVVSPPVVPPPPVTPPPPPVIQDSAVGTTITPINGALIVDGATWEIKDNADVVRSCACVYRNNVWVGGAFVTSLKYEGKVAGVPTFLETTTIYGQYRKTWSGTTYAGVRVDAPPAPPVSPPASPPASPPSGAVNPFAPGGLTTVFFDDMGAFNPNIWELASPQNYNNDPRMDPARVSFANSICTIRGALASDRTHVKSGGLISRQTQDVQPPVYVAARIRTVSNRTLGPQIGTHTGFWLFPRTNVGDLKEVDIVESLGIRPTEVLQTVHKRNLPGANQGANQLSKSMFLTSAVSMVYRVFDLIWLPNKMTFRCDGVVGLEITDQATLSALAGVPYKILLQMFIGEPDINQNVWLGTPVPAVAYEAVTEIDWVHVAR